MIVFLKIADASEMILRLKGKVTKCLLLLIENMVINVLMLTLNVGLNIRNRIIIILDNKIINNCQVFIIYKVLF